MDTIQIGIAGHSGLFEIRLSFKIEDCREYLDKLPSGSTLVSYDFLASIERCPPVGLKPAYAVLLDGEGKGVGFYYFQVIYFKASQSMRFNQDQDFFCRLHKSLKGMVANLVEFNTLVGGNLLLSGPYGSILDPDYKSKDGLIYQHILEEMQGWLRSRGIDTSVTLVKDFPSQDKFFEESTYHSFEVEPNMILTLGPWNEFEDYLDSLLSKYRVRARRALKAASPLQKKELSEAEIAELNGHLFDLYKCTATGADFNLLDLDPGYFLELKKNLGTRFHLYTYSLDDKPIAFYTVIEDGETQEAHYLGIDEALNKNYQLYLNVLLDLIRCAIQRRKKAIRFSRTALEIKSSVGATAHPLTCYIKHRKVINNTFVPYLVDFLNQKREWVPRHPFKEERGERSEVRGLDTSQLAN